MPIELDERARVQGPDSNRGPGRTAGYVQLFERNGAITRWAGPALIAVFIVVSASRGGVQFDDIVRYAVYWCVSLLLPGVIVSRSLIGARRTLVEDLSIAAVTGLAMESLSWVLGVTAGVGSLSRFWWVPIILMGLLVRSMRVRWMVRPAARLPGIHSVSMSALAILLVSRLDLNSYRVTPLPPQGSSMFIDYWWHLSLVQEMMRFERPLVPQVAGETLNYHFFAHIHMAMGSRLSGVLPEVVLFRLWAIPIMFASIGLALTLGRLLTASLGAGVLTAWLAFGVILQNYIWTGIGTFATSPIIFHSPTQTFANVFVVGASIGMVTMMRDGVSRRTLGWVVLIIVGASATKSTVIPVLIAGTVLALCWAAISRSKATRPLLIATSLLLALQAGIFALASGSSGGKVVILGTLKSLPVYKDLVPVKTVRGINNGLLLDSIDSPRTVLFAALALVVTLGIHGSRIFGVAILARQDGRSNIVNWWLSGCVIAGYSATLLIDHVGLSQTFFAMSVVPLGAALTVSAVWQLTADQGTSRRTIALAGLIIGGVLTLFIDYFTRARQRAGGYGGLDRILFPLLLVAGAGVVGYVLRHRIRQSVGSLVGALLVVSIGLLIPSQAEFIARSSYRWAQPVSYPTDPSDPHYVSTAELAAMIWVRSNTEATDVIMTNVHCHPVEPSDSCDVRGFWAVGLSGRRAVLEAWSYTGAAQALQGANGRIFSQQPSPFVEQARLNDAVFENGDLAALGQLVDEYGVRWIVGVRRAGPVPAFPDTVAVTRFDNGDVIVLEVLDQRAAK